MGGGSRNTSSTTQVELTDEQKELYKAISPALKEHAANPPELTSTPLVAPFDPAQMAGQQLALGAAPQQSALANIGAQGNEFLLGPALNPNTNPAFAEAINAAVRPLYENLTESVLPRIRTGAIEAGQFGGSRQGVAEGLAAGRTARAAGDTAANVANQGYQAGLNAFTQGLNLLPQTIGAQATPALTVSGVGDVRQAQRQGELGEIAQRFNYEQIAPFLTAQDIASIITGLPGGSATSTIAGPRTSPIAGGLGGFTLGSALGGPIGIGAGVGGGIGAGAGALLSLLGL